MQTDWVAVWYASNVFELGISMKRTDWDCHFMTIVYTIAAQSKDTSTKVGSVIVGPNRDIRATGYNGAPRGFDDADPRLSRRPDKYLVTEHSERNSIYQCARNGTSCADTSLYVSWMPCMDCARAIIQSGITRVVIHRQGNEIMRSQTSQWAASFAMAEQMMTRCGVAVEWYSDPLPHYVVGQFGGKRYRFDGAEPVEIDITSPHPADDQSDREDASCPDQPRGGGDLLDRLGLRRLRQWRFRHPGVR